MTPISHNFSSSKEMDSNCVCGQSENMEHIYRSMIWNIESEKTSYGKIYSENVHEIKKKVCLNQTDKTDESMFNLHYYTKTY